MAGPSFFLVGAPKCGTTSLCHYLRQHPDIFIPDQKELNFFASDLDMPRYYRNVWDYLKPFGDTAKTVSGEATTWYLYSRTAAQEIRDFNRAAKIIIALRQPTDMIYSLFRHRRYVGLERFERFSQVLEREANYISNLNGGLNVKTNLIYSDAAMYHSQIEKYIEIFGHANVHIALFDDIENNPQDVYRGMLGFLGVSDDFRPSFCNVNKTGRIRSERLRQQLDHPPAAVQRLAYALPRRIRRTAYWTLRRLNVSYAPPPPLDRALRRRLNDKFRPDVERLSALIGRDLTHWFAE